MRIQENYGDIVNDIDRFKDEIREQIEIKKLRYKYFKRLDHEDFVRAQVPETLAMEKLQKSYDQSILNYEGSLQSSDNNADYLDTLKRHNKELYNRYVEDEDYKVMSKDEYRKLRMQIKEKKEAKARLLKQGFPSLKNYVYL